MQAVDDAVNLLGFGLGIHTVGEEKITSLREGARVGLPLIRNAASKGKALEVLFHRIKAAYNVANVGHAFFRQCAHG
jgi:hypothetical protein